MFRLPAGGSRLRLMLGGALLVLTLAAYLARPLLTGAPFLGSGDTIPARLVPASLLIDGNFDLDEFYPASIKQDIPYFLAFNHGHFYSVFPVGGPVLLTPLYAVLQILGADVMGDDLVRRQVAGYTAAVISALSVLVVFAIYARRGPWRALAVAVVYALGTGVWPMCAQDLWQHTFGVLFMALALFCLERGQDDPRWLGWMGLPVGCLFAVRPPNGLMAAVFGLAVLWRSPSRLWRFALLSIPFVVLTVWYNLSVSGNLLGEYRDEAAGISPLDRLAVGLPGLLVSPGRGLFLYSPVLLLGWLALRRKIEPERWSVRLVLAALIVVQTLLYGSYRHWYGGFCFGPRFLLEVMPAYASLLWYAWPTVMAGWLGRTAAVGTAVFAVLANGSGYVCEWNCWCNHPHVDRCPGRLWDWRDNPLMAAAFGLPPRCTQPLDRGGEIMDINGSRVEFYRGWTFDHAGRSYAMGSEAELLLDFGGRPVGQIVLTLQAEAGLPSPQIVTVSVNDEQRARAVLSSDWPERLTIPIRSAELAEQPTRLMLRFTSYRRRPFPDIRTFAAELQGVHLGLW